MQTMLMFLRLYWTKAKTTCRLSGNEIIFFNSVNRIVTFITLHIDYSLTFNTYIKRLSLTICTSLNPIHYLLSWGELQNFLFNVVS